MDSDNGFSCHATGGRAGTAAASKNSARQAGFRPVGKLLRPERVTRLNVRAPGFPTSRKL